jgi:predicted ATPase/DNA-binding CsgD family transcriptional regulator
MVQDINLIGRQREQAELNRAIASAKEEEGRLVLLAGEAGVGKTRLAEEVLTHSGCLVLNGVAREEGTPPYGPIVAALRVYTRAMPDGLASGGPLCKYLALLLPELGSAPDKGDQAMLIEAIRCAFEAITRSAPAVVFLDDLQWADNATLEFLSALAGSLGQERLLIVGAYRSDEIPRGHPVRRLRNELRRARQLHEIVVEPLDQAETAALAARVFGQTPSPSLTTILYDRTQGMPLFIEELAATFVESGRLRHGQPGLELPPGEDIPIPDTLRDAVLLRLDGLSERAWRLVEVAAVAGFQFDLELVVDLAGGDEGLAELVEHSLISEVGSGRAAFRHALTHEAIYEEILWTRRRALHREVAQRLEAGGASAELVAEHWLAGRENDKARQALLLSAQRSCALHAYRDAAQAGQRALELWPEGEDEALRLDVLDQLGNCAQLCGMLADAARAWREVAEGRRQTEDRRQFAEVQRRLATVYELQGAWGKALPARQAAAEAFAATNLPGEAATERLAIAGHLQGVGSYNVALELVAVAVEEAEQAGRQDLIARALGLKGNAMAKLGQFEAGRETAQAGLELALEHNLIGPAAEIYNRLAGTFEQAADYPAARKVYLTAISYCDEHGASAMGQLCMGCVAGVLWQTGEWKQAISLCREVIASVGAPPLIRATSIAYLGIILAYRGETTRARKLLLEAIPQGRWYEAVNIEFYAEWGLAMVDELEADYDSAVEHYRYAIGLWQQTEERHYVVHILRWAVTFFAGRGAEKDIRTCTEALSKIATTTGSPEALAALAYALGEAALLDNEAEQAAQQFGQALELLGQLEAPLQRAETELRAGVALVAAGKRKAGVEHLVNAHRTARKMGARPLAARAVQKLANLGERIDERLSPRAARRLKHGGLTRRQLEVVRQIALGRTNQEIAQELVLSPRTVDMHVGNILTRLDCRTRTEAVRKARELGLLD